MTNKEAEEKIEELASVIKQSVEKQIPKKPIKTKAQSHRLYCPECSYILAFNEDNVDFIKSNKLYNYCPDCGQALDWSDTNDHR